MSSGNTREDALRSIPSVDLAMRHIEDRGLAGTAPRPLVVRAVRRALDTARDDITQSRPEAPDSREAILEQVERSVRRLRLASLRPVINATGILIHTNLGRSPLAPEAVEAARSVSGASSNLEFDLVTGERGHRDLLVRDSLCELTGAEDALVVNNNAAAVLLALNTLAAGREVVVSRGELIEIGGSFRLPEVFGRAGARMVEVGTTNRTTLADFERAYCSRTGAFMKAHWSNYSIEGFVERVTVQELASLAGRYGIPVINDLGSGALMDSVELGIPHEETVAESVAAGAAISTFSGDKLIGGPQCGIVVGGAEQIASMRGNPLMRALRPGKQTLAALQATLELFLDGSALDRVPVLAMAAASADDVRIRAERFLEHAGDRLLDHGVADVVETSALMGGGTAPEAGITSFAVRFRPRDLSVDRLAARLRTGMHPVVARTADDALMLDMRTVPVEDEEALLSALTQALRERNDDDGI